MKFALHTSTAISSVLKEPEHFYVDIYYLIILIIVAFTLLLLSFLRYHLYKTKKEKELREIASLVDKNEILIQRYSREMSHIKEQLEAKEKCLKEYQHAAQWKAHRDVESLIKEKERLAKCLLEQLDTFKKLKILSKSETILPDSDWRNLIEIVNTLYDDFYKSFTCRLSGFDRGCHSFLLLDQIAANLGGADVSLECDEGRYL